MDEHPAHRRKRRTGPTHAVGDAAVGDAAVGDAAVGDAAVGDAAVGDAAVGDVAVGDAAVGDAAVGDARVRPGAAPALTPGGGRVSVDGHARAPLRLPRRRAPAWHPLRSS